MFLVGCVISFIGCKKIEKTNKEGEEYDRDCAKVFYEEISKTQSEK